MILLLLIVLLAFIMRYSALIASNANTLFSHMAAIPSKNGNLLGELPSNMILISIAVFHRHGDRSQISKSMDKNDISDEENNYLREIWKSLMPSSESMERMRKVAIEDNIDDPAQDTYIITNDSENLDSLLYSGWERNNYPYGMLTERGHLELYNVGQVLRQRSLDLFPYNKKINFESFYCRSTNFCRTKQSLRSLLSGFILDNEILSTDSNTDTDTNSDSDSSSSTLQIKINSNPKGKETLFPQADGPCNAMGLRRAELYADDWISQNFNYYNQYNYEELSDIVKKELLNNHLDVPINWLTIREILVCHFAHNITSFTIESSTFTSNTKNITSEMIVDIDRLSGLMWHRLFDDDIMNRLAIGRFIKEFSDLQNDIINGNSPVKMMIYSGHDSTLVPILCALGIDYNGIWPPYASHLEFELAKNLDDNELYARAIFNNEEVYMHGCKDLWCPYWKIKRRLNDLSITNEIYKNECNIGGGFGNNAEMEAEIKATSG